MRLGYYRLHLLFLAVSLAPLLLLLAAATSARAQLTFEPVAKSGQSAPGVTGGTWQFFSAPHLANDGGIAFGARMIEFGSIDTSNQSGLWGRSAGNFQLIAREGNPAPGAGGQPWLDQAQSDPLLANGGKVAFISHTDSPQFGDDAGVWSGTIGSSPSKVALDGDPAAGSTNGETYRNFGSAGSRPDVNNVGQVVFEGAVGILSSSGGTFSNSIRNNLWVGSPGNVTLVAEGRNRGGFGGDPVPGIPDHVWSSFLSPVINDSGQIAVRGFTRADDNSSNFSEGIWAGSPQNLTLIAAQGDVAPGTGGDTWTSFTSGSSSSGPAINNNGLVAFHAEVEDSSGNTNEGIWASNAGGPRLIVQAGIVAPGDPDLTINGFGHGSINDGGQLAVTAALSGPGINANNNEVIYATDAYGQLMKVYREREALMFDGVSENFTSFGLSETGAISGDPTQGTARLGLRASYFNAGGQQSAVVTVDLNDVFIDADITRSSLWLGDQPGVYETAGDLHVGFSSTEIATLYLTHFPPKLTAGEPLHDGPVTVIAENAYYGVRPGTTGEAYIESDNNQRLTGNLFVGGDPTDNGGTGYVEVRDGGELLVEGSTTIAEGSSLNVLAGGTFTTQGERLVTNGTLSIDTAATLAMGANTEFSGDGQFDLSLVADAGVVLSPGNSPGSLGITDLTLADGAYDWELTTLPSMGTAGVDWDLVQSSLLDVSASPADPFTINVLDIAGTTFDPDQSYSWLIAQSDSPITGFDANHFIFDLTGASQFAAAGDFSVGLVDLGGGAQGLAANFNAGAATAFVPEPASGLLLLAIGACIAFRRRRVARPVA